ncbi:MAG: hypothetical protein ABIO24_01625, partial [Saprospiraceae bacterium]
MQRLIFFALSLFTFQSAFAAPIVTLHTHSFSAPLTIHLDSIQGIDCKHATGYIAVSAAGGLGPYTFSWSNGLAGAVHSGLTTGDYTIQVMDLLGFEAELTATIGDDKVLPTVDAGPPYTVNCSNAVVMLTGTASTGAHFSYLWTAENGGNILSGATTLVPTINKSGKFVLTVTNNQNGCTAADFTTVTAQHVAPIVSVLGDTITCSQPLAQLTSSYNSLHTTIFWQGPNGYYSSLPQPMVSVMGNYFFTVTDTATECATKVKAIVLLDTVSPPVSISVSGMLSCQQNTVQLIATAAPTGLKFNWTGPNNFSSTLQNPTVNAPGTYVLIVASTKNGCTSQRSLTVAGSLGLPTAIASVTGILTCTNAFVTLNGNSTTQGVSYSWTGPGGFNANTQNAAASVPGIYTLTVKNNSNGCSATASTTVTQNLTPPTVTATGGNKTCAQPTVTLTAMANVSGAAYAWSGPNNFYSTVQNPSVSTLGAYTVTVTNPQNGCSATAFASVGQNITTPTVTASAGTLTCIVPQVKLMAMSNTQGISYAWSGPGGFTSSLPSPMVAAEGYYGITVTNPANGCSSSTTTYVYKDNTPPNAYAGGERSLNCFFTSLVINPIGTSMGSQYTYSWTTEEGNIVAGANSFQARVDAVGTYRLLVTNTQNGCTAISEMNVIQSPPVTAAISQTQSVACNGGTNGSATVVAGGGNGNYHYTWPNGSTSATLTGVGAG